MVKGRDIPSEKHGPEQGSAAISARYHKRAAVSLPNGVTTTYTYDSLNRLTLETVTRGGANVARFDYNFDDGTGKFKIESDGQRGGVVETRYDQNGNVFSTTRIDYAYDAWNRLTSEFRDGGTFSTNGLPNDGDDYLATYSYDLGGNRRRLRVWPKPAAITHSRPAMR